MRLCGMDKGIAENGIADYEITFHEKPETAAAHEPGVMDSLNQSN